MKPFNRIDNPKICKLLQQYYALISMTQNGDPYENAMAERVNGILKSELIAENYADAERPCNI